MIARPRFAPGAADRVRDIDHLAELLWAWRVPEIVWTDPLHSDREHRRRGDVHLIVTDDDVIIGLMDAERPQRSKAAPQSKRAARRGKRGGAGSRWPTTIRELTERARAAGGAVDVGRKHMRVTLPDGGTVSLGQTPSDYRAVKNCALQLHRAGLNVARF